MEKRKSGWPGGWWVVEMQRYNVGNYNSINALSAILLRLLSCILRLLMPTYTFSQYSKHMIRSRKIAQGEWAGGKRGRKRLGELESKNLEI